MFALAALVIAPLSVETGYGQDLAAQEAIRRAADVQTSDELLKEGRKAYAEGDYDTAFQKYREASNILPYGTATTDRRKRINEHLQSGAIALAQKNRRLGKLTEARDLLTEADKNDPNNPQIRKHLEFLDDPIRTSPTLTYDHTQNIEKVKHALYRGESYYNSGLYDKAEAEFKNVLRIDPYNVAARRWMERCNAIKSNYYRAAYDQTRAEMLMQVDKAWELAVPPLNVQGPVFDPGGEGPGVGQETITAKLNQIILPDLTLNNVTVEEAVEYLRLRSVEYDNTTTDPSKKGINFVVQTPTVVNEEGGEDAEAGFGAEDPNAKIIDNLNIKNIPLRVALQYICDQADLRFNVDEYAVTLLPRDGGKSAAVVQREWTVPPTFEAFLSDSSPATGGGVDDPFAPDAGGGSAFAPRLPMQELLQNSGVSFNNGATASFLRGSNKLIVRNTPTQLELVDGIVKASISDTPRQIRVTTKFVEVSQENDDELGFDWVVTPFGVGSNYFLGGGTIGNGAERTGGDFIGTVDGVTIPGVPSSSTESVSNIVTAGNRSGATAITGNSIDSLLSNPDRTATVTNVAPGILSLTGLFGSGQVQVIMRGLAQKRGADIMTAPSVIALPGQSATIEIIREFIYPTEYEPPELPNQVGNNNNNGGGVGGIGGGGGAGFPVTPATPSAFDTKNTGVTLEVEANIDSNDSIIELRFTPTIVEFEGFVNYGSPITTPTTDALGNPVQIVITENRIEMPVFSVRKVVTGLTIYDGYTVAVGGLMSEDVQSVEDKVPVLGDLPLIGRLFQTKAQSHIKSNLIIFVTAEIIDATGRRVNGSTPEFSPEESLTPVPDFSVPVAGPGVLPLDNQ